jgi:hypothetical protein
MSVFLVVIEVVEELAEILANAGVRLSLDIVFELHRRVLLAATLAPAVRPRRR